MAVPDRWQTDRQTLSHALSPSYIYVVDDQNCNTNPCAIVNERLVYFDWQTSWDNVDMHERFLYSGPRSE